MEGLLLTGDIVYLAPMGESEKQRKNIVWRELQSLGLSTPVLESRVQCVVERRGH